VVLDNDWMDGFINGLAPRLGCLCDRAGGMGKLDTRVALMTLFRRMILFLRVTIFSKSALFCLCLGGMAFAFDQ
jgi:hypothetical protein